MTVRGADGSVWRGQVLTDGRMRASLRVRWSPSLPPPPGTPVVTRPPPGPPPMNAADFQRLRTAIASETFTEGKLSVLQMASTGSTWFDVSQVGALVGLFSFENDKLKAIATVRSRIVDRQNGYQLLSLFTFDHDKKKVRQLLEE